MATMICRSDFSERRIQLFRSSVERMRLLWIGLIIFFFTFTTVQAQVLTGFSAHWSDSFAAWDFYADSTEETGALRQKWEMNNDWTEWEYSLGSAYGTIKQKYKGDPSFWEARGDNYVITARTVYPNDFREWQVTDNSHTYTLSPRWGNNAEEWLIRERKSGDFSIYTSVEGDPRDWTVEDNLDESVPFPMKMLMAFLAVYNSTPKR